MTCARCQDRPAADSLLCDACTRSRFKWTIAAVSLFVLSVVGVAMLERHGIHLP